MFHGTEQLTVPLYIHDRNLPSALIQIRIILLKVNYYFFVSGGIFLLDTGQSNVLSLKSTIKILLKKKSIF